MHGGHRKLLFEIDDLRILCEIVEHRSFTAAARALNYTQSAVSRRIASLEHAAGQPLLERLPRGARLTPAGAALHRHALAVLARLADANAELAAIRAGRGGRLRIGAFISANARLVPEALKDFQRRLPAVEITLTEALSHELIHELGRGTVDVAVVSDYPSALPAVADVELLHLMDEELLLALPHNHPLAGKSTIRLRDLANERWIEAPPPSPTLLADAGARAGFAPRVPIRVRDWTGKLGFTAAGLGVTLVPALMASAVRPDLTVRSLGKDLPRRRVYVALAPASARLPAADEFVRCLQAVVTESPAPAAPLDG